MAVLALCMNNSQFYNSSVIFCHWIILGCIFFVVGGLFDPVALRMAKTLFCAGVEGGYLTLMHSELYGVLAVVSAIGYGVAP